MRSSRLPLLAFGLPLLALTAFGTPACQAPADETVETGGDQALTERTCIIDRAVTADGYTRIEEADESLVSRKRLDASGALVPDPEKVARPTDAQLATAMHKISVHLDRVNSIPGDMRRHETYSQSSRGQTPEPYCLFHAAGKAVYGTVVLFHGFNDRPHQQAKLASYLFHNGFNVYNVFLANHMMVPGTQHWPKTVYKPEVLATLQRKLGAPENQAVLQPLLPRIQAGEALSNDDLAALDRVLSPELSVDTLKSAWTDPGGQAWQKLFLTRTPAANESLAQASASSDFMDFVRDASARIADLDSLPGPVFVGGLSVGGTVALAAAAADGGRRVRAVMSHAPWLQSIEPKNNLQVMLAGPLDEKIALAGGQYPIAWANHQIAFSPASIAADLALGAWTARPENVRKLATIPTAQIVTDDEDSADNTASGALHAAFTMEPRVAPMHVRFAYPKSLHVGHAMTDPENYVDGPADTRGWNQYWRTLYQESFRFYTTGTISPDNVGQKRPDANVPTPPCSMPDFSDRCGQ